MLRDPLSVARSRRAILRGDSNADSAMLLVVMNDFLGFARLGRGGTSNQGTTTRPLFMLLIFNWSLTQKLLPFSISQLHKIAMSERDANFCRLRGRRPV